MEIPTQPPEAKLIEELREGVRPKLSVRKAADSAGISEGRWRQIAKGYNQVSKDTYVPSIAPADTLARMARVVGAVPDQLRAVGREDAATELAKIERDAEVDKHADAIMDALPDTSPSWIDSNTEGGRLNRKSLSDLITAYVASRDDPPEDRAERMAEAALVAIATVRQVLILDGDRTVRAHAIDALNPAEAAVTFLIEALGDMKGAGHDMEAAQESPASSEASSHEKTDADSADDVKPSSAAAAADAITAAAVAELEVDGVDNNREQA